MSGAEALLRAADKALYVAKFAGRNCIREDGGYESLSNHAAE
jgi:PleD family two-component response regulator